MKTYAKHHFASKRQFTKVLIDYLMALQLDASVNLSRYRFAESSDHIIGHLFQIVAGCANSNEIRQLKKENVPDYFLYRLQKTAF